MTIRLILFALLLLVLCAGCKDSDLAQLKSMGSRHHVQLLACDGHVIQEWHSTGNVSNESESDGWFFEDEKTHKLVEVTGVLVIEQE
jgi:hypothetical protein